jgi:hypothetical protein
VATGGAKNGMGAKNWELCEWEINGTHATFMLLWLETSVIDFKKSKHSGLKI